MSDSNDIYIYIYINYPDGHQIFCGTTNESFYSRLILTYPKPAAASTAVSVRSSSPLSPI